MASQQDKPVMLITGGSGSVGREIGAQAAEAGWRVALNGRNEDKLARAVRQINAGRAEAFSADIGAPGAVEALVEATGARYGRIDAVIDCVATGPGGITGSFHATAPDAYAPFLDLSLAHLQRLAHASLPWLSKQGGTLIAFASDAGLFAARRQSIIGASRAGIMGFVRNLALEVAPEGVRVHCISPSYIDGSDALNRLAGTPVEGRMESARQRAGLGLPTAADIAPLAMFLCGEGARRITGQVISVNGGLNA